MEEALARESGGAPVLCCGGEEGLSLELRDILCVSPLLNKVIAGKPRSRRPAATLARLASISTSSVGDTMSVKSGT